MILDHLKNKRVAILGLGMEGEALTQFLDGKAKNIALLDQLSEKELQGRAEKERDNVLLQILNNKKFEHRFGPSYLNNLTDFEIIFRSPGIPYLHDKIQQAKEKRVVISSQIKLFFDLCPCPIIGVTGTKGKGTTATLISLMLQSNKVETTRPNTGLDTVKRKVYLAGNIGEPAITLIDKLSRDDIIVLELSSFQLQDLEISPHIAIVLNISVDHLDYHKDKIEYRDAKLNIVRHQNKNNFAIINQDFLTAFEFASQTAAQIYYFSSKDSIDQRAYIKECKMANVKCQMHQGIYEVVLRMGDKEEVVCRSDEIKLLGKHNLENIAAAAAAAKIAGADINSIRSVAKKFSGLPHRLEFVVEINRVKFYNDSFATNPAPTMAAIDSFVLPIHLILGGSSKGADFKKLAQRIKNSSVESVNLIGVEAQKIAQALKKVNFNRKIHFLSGNIDQIVKTIFGKAKRGEIILLSPACASFDMFKNYKDRGEQFKRAVIKLKNK